MNLEELRTDCAVKGFGAEIYYSNAENEIGFAYMEIWALCIEGR